VVYVESALAHHLLNVAVRKLEATVPSDTQKDERRLEVPSLERGLILLHEYDSQWVMAELKGGL
jgi:hypothetical protein